MEVRPIDANALLKKGKCSQYTGDFIPLNDLKNAPTLDYEPVVHAHWVKPSWGGSKHGCSNCGHTADLSKQGSEYCSYCGAKMDEEVDC